MTPKHKDYVGKLMKIGTDLGFYVADGRKLGKMRIPLTSTTHSAKA